MINALYPFLVYSKETGKYIVEMKNEYVENIRKNQIEYHRIF